MLLLCCNKTVRNYSMNGNALELGNARVQVTGNSPWALERPSQLLGQC